MKIKLCTEDGELLAGVREISPILKLELCGDGISVEISKTQSGLFAALEHGKGKIGYSKKVEFFRALGLFAQYAPQGDFFRQEQPAFQNLSAMYDNSRNAVFGVDTIKRLLRHLALMGYHGLMLYTEDTYEVEGYPYFGHMRGRYTKEEIQECDRYAQLLGIELSPCIQTLAHLNAAFKWQQFREINDCNDILLIDDPKTYELIDAMLGSLSRMYSSRSINIGMDEAHMVGLGKYLDKHGFEARFDLICRHLKRVIALCEKYGFHPTMWSDMFFRVIFSDYYNTAEIDPELLKLVPSGVTLAYWDYYSEDKAIYDRMFENHLKFKNEVAFAGGAWKWEGLAPENQFSFKVSRLALQSCREHGIKTVIVTGWGDNGAECSSFATLPVMQLFAEECYTGDADDSAVASRLAVCANADLKDFFDLDLPNLLPGNEAPGGCSVNPSKYLLYQDVLCGLFDDHVKPEEAAPFYAKSAQKVKEAGQRNPEWSKLFDTSAALCSVLEIKAGIGALLSSAYKAGDREELARLNEELPELLSRVETLHTALRAQWMSENKIFGLEIIDIRFGALKERIKAAHSRLAGYLAGSVESMDELAQPRLNYLCNGDDTSHPHISVNQWHEIVSACIV